MQKKLIVLAVAGLMSGAAFAQTSVTLSGRADAGYQFKRTSNADVATESAGGKTTETQADGSAGTSEIIIVAKETINPSLELGINFNLRYGNLHEGKTGITSNDKKVMTVSVPYVTAQFGVANLMSGEYKLSEKPYAGKVEWEGVKWGISLLHEEQLTNRNTSFWTDPKKLAFGPVALLFKGTYVGGDHRKNGANDDGSATGTATSSAITYSDTSKRSGDVTVLGMEFKLFDNVNGGMDVNNRQSDIGLRDNGMTWNHYYVSGRPIKDLKLGFAYNNYKGRANSESSPNGGLAFQTKTWSYHVNYMATSALELGLSYSVLADMGSGANSDRNSGTGLMLGANYSLSKTTQLYLGYSKNDYEQNIAGIAGQKYVGSKDGMVDKTGDKFDDRYVRVGIVKKF